MAVNKEYDEVQLDVEFTQASTRENLVSKENISISFGKISKYFADLHSQAFTGYTHPTYTARTGKPTGNQTPGFGATFTISQITSDGTGHVTGATDRTVKIPNTTMGAATADAAGSIGLVPAPAAGKQTSFLRGDGTWVVPTNTDTKVTDTVGTANTYYPAGLTGTTTTTGTQVFDTSFKFIGTTGTTSAVGKAQLVLGNATASGTANNKQGSIVVYGSTAYAHTIQGAPTAARTLTLPDKGGTFALTSDIPSVPTVNDAALTLKGAGTTVTTFTANSSSAKSLDIVAGSNVTITPDATNSKISIASSHPTITKSADTTSTASPAHGGTFTTVDSVTRDGNGHVTKINTKTVTLPADSNTDTKVSQTLATADNNRPLLMSYYLTGETTTTAQVVHRNDGLFFNPSSGGLYSFGFLWTDITGSTLDINTLTLSNGTPHSRRFIEKTDGGATNITNIPVAGKPFLLEVDLIRWASTTDYITRQRFTNAANGTYSYVRYCTNGTWGSWTTRKYTDTDTKVTSSANHYAPATVSGQDKSASATGATAAWSIDVVKGVTLNTDGKGHVTGISVTSGKIPGNPVPSNNVTGSGTSGYLTKWNGINTITNGPQLGSSTTTYLRNDGTWATPTNTTYSAGTGLSLSGTTFNHSNSVTAVTSAVFKKITYDAQGHITGTANVAAADIPSLNYVPNTQAGVNAAINLLSTGDSTPSLADYIVTQYVNGGTTTTSYHRRPISLLWNTFKELITLTTTGSGNAVTDVSIANDGDHNRKITVTKGSTFSLSTHTHSYLPLSGGTMTGDITFTGVGTSSYPSKSKGIYWSGGTDAIDMYYNLGASDAGELIINMRDDSNVRTSFAYNGTVKSYIDTNGTYNGNASKTGIRWNAVSQGQKWSRLYYSEAAVNIEGSNGILSISCTRGNVVVNAVFLVFVSHSGSNASHIIELASTNYSTIRCRVVSNSGGSYYFEIYDTANNIASGTSQTWHCCFVTLTDATLTTYTTFTDGSTIPSNFTATNDFTTTVGKASAAIKDISRSGTTFTATRQDGTTFTFTQQDNNTTYSANNGVGLSGTTFYNSGVRAVSTGSANGTISVNTNGNTGDVPVKGLASAAYVTQESLLRARSTVSTDGGATGWSQIGINQYNNAYPDGVTNKIYGWGAVVSIPAPSARFDLYYNHISSAADSITNGLQYRTGWNDDKKAWRMLIDNVNYTEYMPYKKPIKFQFNKGITNGYWAKLFSANYSGYNILEIDIVTYHGYDGNFRSKLHIRFTNAGFVPGESSIISHQNIAPGSLRITQDDTNTFSLWIKCDGTSSRFGYEILNISDESSIFFNGVTLTAARWSFPTTFTKSNTAPTNAVTATRYFALDNHTHSFADPTVTQAADNSGNSDSYELLISNSANNTTETAGVRKSTRLRFNPSKGRVIMQGPLIVRATDGVGSYDEGIRINAGKNGYSTLSFGGGQDTISGTADGQFWIGTNITNDSYKRKLYIAHATSTDSGTYFYASSATQGSPALKLGTSGSIVSGNGDAVTGGVVYTALSNYLPLSGTTINNPNTSSVSFTNGMTGNILFTNTGNTNGVARGIGGIVGDTDSWSVRGYQTSNNRGCLEIAVGDDGDEGIYVRQYTSGAYKATFSNNAGSASGLTYRELVLMAPSTGASTFPSDVTLSGGQLYLSGGSGSYGQINLKTSSYNVMLRQDNSNTFFLVTAQGDPNGGWTSARPLTINNSTGFVTMENGASISSSAYGALSIKRTEPYSAGIKFYNNGSTYLGSLAISTVNGTFHRFKTDEATSYEIIDRSVVRNNTVLGTLGWTSSSADTVIPTVNTIAFWNGAYSGTSSNLAYCNKGAFGTIVTKSTTDYSKVSITRNLTSGTKVGTITIDGTATDLYCETNTTNANQTNTTTNADYRVLFSTNANDTTQSGTTRKNINLQYNPSTATLKIGEYASGSTATKTGKLVFGNSLNVYTHTINTNTDKLSNVSLTLNSTDGIMGTDTLCYKGYEGANLASDTVPGSLADISSLPSTVSFSGYLARFSYFTVLLCVGTDVTARTTVQVSAVNGYQSYQLIWGGAPNHSGGNLSITSGLVNITESSGTITLNFGKCASYWQFSSSSSNPTKGTTPDIHVLKVYGHSIRSQGYH